MIPSLILLTLIVVIVAKIIYDVQKTKLQIYERAYLQVLAGIKIDEDLEKKVRTRKLEMKAKQRFKTSKTEKKEKAKKEPKDPKTEAQESLANILMAYEKRKGDTGLQNAFDKLVEEHEKDTELNKQKIKTQIENED